MIILEEVMMRDNRDHRKCLMCGKAFAVFRKWQTYCSSACRVAAWQARHPRIDIDELKRLRGNPTKIHG
jgi:predicted nucleic acid-binding Zn ribbon protein